MTNFDNQHTQIDGTDIFRCELQTFNKRLSPPNVEDRGSLLREQNKYGDTILHLSALFGTTNNTRTLVADVSQENKFSALCLQNKQGMTATRIASRKGHDTHVREHLQGLLTDQQVTLLSKKDLEGITAIHAASVCGNDTVTEALFRDINADRKVSLLNIQCKKGHTAIHYAVSNNKLGVLKIQMSDLEQRHATQIFSTKDTNGKTPLHRVNSPEAVGIIRESLQNSWFDLLKEKDANGDTVLHIAARSNNTDLVTSLLEGLTDPQKIELIGITNKGKRNAVQEAVRSEYSHSLDILVKNIPEHTRKDIFNSKDSRGRNAMHYASEINGLGLPTLIIPTAKPPALLEDSKLFYI